MMDPQHITRLESLFRQILELGEAEDPRAVDRESDERWDSLRHVLLVSAIESEFSTELSVSESMSLAGFDDAVAVVGRAGVER